MKKPKNNKGKVLWITGLPGSGKTTIAKKIKKPFEKLYGKTLIYSGDDIRKIFALNHYNYEKRILIAKMYSNFMQNLSNQNINVIIATVALFKKIHNLNRKKILNYCEIFIKVSSKIIIKNNKKKLYNRLNKDLVGIDIVPEFPKKPDIIIKNDFKTNLDNLSKNLLIKIEKFYKNFD